MERAKLIDLLLDCLHLDASCVDADRLAALTETDWEALVALATEQQVCALLTQQLKSRGLDAVVPDVTMQVLRDFYLQNAARNLRLCNELKRIVETLRADDVSSTGEIIPVIVLKGLHLATQVYDNIALRQMGDLDLLVPKQHLQRAADALITSGYKPLKPYSVDVDVALSQHLTAFIKSEISKIDKVEIHWTLTKPNQPYTIAVDELWVRAVPLQIAGIDVLGLCSEDLLLHLCLHTSYQHQFAFGLRPSCDIAYLIQHCGETFDWGTVQQRAEAWGWGRGVYLALRVAQELVGANVPGDVLRQLEPFAFEETVVATARNQIFTSWTPTGFLSRELARLMGRDNLWASLRDFARRIFLPRVVLAKHYSVSANSPKVYLYYLVRFKDVLVRHGRTAWRILQKDPEIAPLADRTRDLLDWLSSG
ncbi:nucleotidyltransferase family protein [Candidatus Bipolaricaulota bacterium]|nr:nucleotidyltransferase family protein [Candidatus Bipolaricaulota bacterium]